MMTTTTLANAMRTMTALAALCLLLATAQAADNPPADGLRLPEQRYDYIVKLLERKYYDLAAEQSELFLRLYPDSPLAEDVAICAINANLSLPKPNCRKAASLIHDCLKKHPKTKRRRALRLQLAKCYMDMGSPAAAIVHFTPLSKGNDGIAEEAAYLAARCHIDLKQNERALPLLERLASLPLDSRHPYSIDALRYLAEHKQAAGDYAGALKDCRALLSSKELPRDLRNRTYLTAGGICFQHLADYQQADDFFGRYLAESDGAEGRAAVVRRMLECRYQLKKYDDFLALAARYCHDYPGISAKDTDLYLKMANLRQQRDELDQALPLLEELYDKHPLPPQMREQVFLAYVNGLAATGAFGKMRAAISKYLEDTPNTPRRAWLLAMDGDAAMSMKDDDGAIASFRQAVPLFSSTPESFQAYSRKLAYLLQKSRQFSEAAMVWRQLADTLPQDDSAMPMFCAAQCLKEAGSLEESKAILDALIKRIGPLAAAEKKGILHLRYDLAIAEKDHGCAIRCVDALAQLADGPDRFKYLCAMAMLQFHVKQPEAAAAAWAQALKIDGIDKDRRHAVLQKLTYLEMRLGRVEDALAHAEELLDGAPSTTPVSPELLGEIAQFARRNSRRTLAADALRLAIAAPECPEEARTRHCVQLAELLVQDSPGDAQKLLEELYPPTGKAADGYFADIEALVAELAIRQKQYDKALDYAGRSLERRNEKTVLDSTIPRALWAKAIALHEFAHDSKMALKFATPCYIMYGKYTPYSTECAELARKIYRAKGDHAAADAIKLDP